MIDFATLGPLAGVLVAALAAVGWLIRWQIGLVVDRMGEYHQTVLALLEGQAHADGSPPAFHRLTRSPE